MNYGKTYALAAALAVSPLGFASAQSYRIPYAFQGSPDDGAAPSTNLINVRGTFYGTTYSGGSSDAGTVFAFDPKTGVETTIYSFRDTGVGDGAYPTASLVDVGGTLYGTTQHGGAVATCQGEGCGTVYSIDPTSGAEHVVYAFVGGNDGSEPLSTLINVNGMLYGTTFQGGNLAPCTANQQQYGCGTVFMVNPNTGQKTILYSFQGGKDGAGPSQGASLLDVGSILYGVTLYGGGSKNCNGILNGCGTVFSINLTSGIEKVVHAFGRKNDGAAPFSPLIDVSGTLYGTTSQGGNATYCKTFRQNGCGTIFSIVQKTGSEKVVYSFQGGSDAWNPAAGLLKIGTELFGTTENGGSTLDRGRGYGTVFMLDIPTDAETVVYAFQGGPIDGSTPTASLISFDNDMFGTTFFGASSGCEGVGCGSIFSLENSK